MTLEFFNETTSISRKYSRQFWGKALQLAQMYGWRPLGTRPPNGNRFHELKTLWNGNYLTNDGQIVLAQDALGLANALETAMDDISDENWKIDWNPGLWIEDDLPEWLSPEERETVEEGLEEHALAVTKMHPFVFFAGDEKRHLRQFIRFCRLGSFSIL